MNEPLPRYLPSTENIGFDTYKPFRILRGGFLEGLVCINTDLTLNASHFAF